MKQAQVTEHFNKIAKDYDFYKKRNLFSYYSILKNRIKEIVAPKSRVLDYGCGTGEILSFLSPAKGIGYDPSPEMFKIARAKFRNKKNLKFTGTVSKIKGSFDYIIMVDVLEHLPDPLGEFKKIRKLMGGGTKLIVSFVDTQWEWFPKTLEMLKLKMPEGPHKRISYPNLLRITKKAGLKLTKPAGIFYPIKIAAFVKR